MRRTLWNLNSAYQWAINLRYRWNYTPGSVRLRASAEVFVLGSQLFTKIWVRAMIGLLKKVIDRLANQVERKFETQFR